jgi:hypothetical protein
MARMLTTAIVAAALLALAPLASAGGPSVRSTVAIDYYFSEAESVSFDGHVASPRQACVKGRRVAIVGRDAGDDSRRVLSRGRAQGSGDFSISVPIPFPEDYAYARIRRKRLATGAVCAGDRSPEINTAGRI